MRFQGYRGGKWQLLGVRAQGQSVALGQKRGQGGSPQPMLSQRSQLTRVSALWYALSTLATVQRLPTPARHLHQPHLNLWLTVLVLPPLPAREGIWRVPVTHPPEGTPGQAHGVTEEVAHRTQACLWSFSWTLGPCKETLGSPACESACRRLGHKDGRRTMLSGGHYVTSRTRWLWPQGLTQPQAS